MSSFQMWCLLQVSNKLGRGHVYHGVASPLLFKTVWRRLVIEVMSFWSFGVAIWSHSCWRVRGHLWHILRFMMHQMFSIGERSGLLAGQFTYSSTTKLCCCNSCSMWFCTTCWNTHNLEGSICCSKTAIYLSAFLVPSKTCKMPIPYALMHPHTIRDAGFWTERW